MHLAILANDQLKKELEDGGVNENCKIDWIKNADNFSLYKEADAMVGLLFEKNDYKTSHLEKCLPKPVIVSSVNKTIGEIGLAIVRINAWPGFLKRNIAEMSCNNESIKKQAEEIMGLLNKKAEWVPDIKGFVAARVISMIVNEAYFALEENVSTKQDIDVAMKLGTNYPYGPFEWAQKIGLKNIAGLLSDLSQTEKRYQPARLLIKEMLS